eukprot:TRINITY_DN7170_c0_g1_i1.p1 TRINITY_DN7170_c0_g1~~TRINITY_DN7170_c0_g1_i1.p1  ORF type:complete len:563 (-),score=100.65 TRINITY_DN7170_c0_g1_i1:69-1757(-)
MEPEDLVKAVRHEGHLKSVMAEAQRDAQGVLHLPHEIEAGPVEYKRTLVHASEERIVHLTSQMKWRLREGGGEALYEIGVDDDGTAFGLCPCDLEKSLKNLAKMARNLNAEISVLCEREGQEGKVCELLVRELREDRYLDIRFAVCGNVSAGKSTLVGVLCFGELDDGDGAARIDCFTHPHELISGQTSSITQEIMGFDREGNCINYSSIQDMSWGDIIEQSYRVISFFDLAGHERYLKTTLYGMSGQMPDYSFLVVSAESGVGGTTREHYELSVALKIPVVIVITHIDSISEEELQVATEKIIFDLNLTNPMTVSEEDDLKECFELLQDPNTCCEPIFFVSCVTGQSLDLLRTFLSGVPPRLVWGLQLHEPEEVVIDKSYDVSGVGTVVTGTVVSGTVHPNSELLLGPKSDGSFTPVTINSVHKKRVPVNQIVCGDDGSFALQDTPRSQIRKGMVLVSSRAKPKAVWTFEANVVSTSVRTNIEPIVQSRTVRQSARIWHVEGTDVRSSLGAKSNIVCFKFKYQPEYVKPGMRIILREAGCKGIGTITKVDILESDYTLFST